jgi:hypothetical protein
VPNVPAVGPKDADGRLIAIMTTLYGAPRNGGPALVKAAHEACDLVAQGETLSQLADKYTQRGFTFTESVVFVNTAVAIYCPDK